ALKARLNSMPISMASTGRELAMKWVGATVVTAVPTGLVVLYLIPSEKEYTSKITQNTNTTNIPQEVVNTDNEKTNASKITPVTESKSIEKNDNSSAVIVKNKSSQNSAQQNISSVEIDAYKENVDFSEIAEADGDLSKAHQAVNAPTSNLTSENNKLS